MSTHKFIIIVLSIVVLVVAIGFSIWWHQVRSPANKVNTILLNQYRHPELNYCLSYPKDWVVDEYREFLGSNLIASFRDPETSINERDILTLTNGSIIEIAIVTIPEDQSDDELFTPSGYIDNLINPQTVVVQRSERQISGQLGLIAVVNEVPTIPAGYRTYAYVRKGNFGFLLTGFFSDELVREKNSAVLDAMIDSFSISGDCS